MRCYWHQMGQSMTTEQNKETKKNRRKFWSFQDLNISEKSKTDTSETPWCVPQLQKKTSSFKSFLLRFKQKEDIFYIFAHLLVAHIRCAHIHLLHAAIANKRQTAQKGAKQKRDLMLGKSNSIRNFSISFFSYFLGAHGQLLLRSILFCENRNWICIFK